jgi:hypothetical protein
VSESPRRQPTVWSLQAGTVRGGREGELYGLDDLDDNQFLAVAPHRAMDALTHRYAEAPGCSGFGS